MREIVDALCSAVRIFTSPPTAAAVFLLASAAALYQLVRHNSAIASLKAERDQQVGLPRYFAPVWQRTYHRASARPRSRVPQVLKAQDVLIRLFPEVRVQRGAG